MKELERLIELSDYHLDYTQTDSTLSDLTGLAARITGAGVALVNLIDRYTQWTVAGSGSDMRQIRREDSACQYTIQQGSALELRDLKDDPRFKDKDYVCGGPELNYYYGVPLTTDSGAHIGALCVLDKQNLELSHEQTDQLQILAGLVVRRLDSIKESWRQQERLKEAEKSKRKAAHDIRGPISGILGIADLLKENLEEGNYSESEELLHLIERSGHNVIELADSILSEGVSSAADFTCKVFAEKIDQLYTPQALSKQVQLTISANEGPDGPIYFTANSLLQIAGNLVNNAIKFTPEGGEVNVRISIELEDNDTECLCLEVEDSGEGMSPERIQEILQGQAESKVGTVGERGYGLGLPLVRQLVEKRNGHLELVSKSGEGCHFSVRLPI